MNTSTWEELKVKSRVETLRDIENRVKAFNDKVMEDIIYVMKDYEVDLYRYIKAVGERIGMDKALEIMSDTVTEKRIKWFNEIKDRLDLKGTEVEKAFNLWLRYLKLDVKDVEIIDKSESRVMFKRKEYPPVISYTCKMLDLDVDEVNRKVYERATDILLSGINPKLKYRVSFREGWYEEIIELR